MRRATPALAAPAPEPPLEELPGHCIRRLQQTAVALFAEETGKGGLTPVQYAVLKTLGERPGVDQRTLAGLVSFDTSTIGGVVDRLQARGAITRSHSAEDRRVWLLHLTPGGKALLAESTPPMHRAQQRMLDPLTADERREFMRMVRTVIAHHAGLA